MLRRNFLRTSAAAVGWTALSYSRVLGANDRVSLGFIGLGNRGDQVLDAFLEHGDSQIDALCDLRRDYMDYHYERTAQRGERTRYQDFRKLLERKGLDATVICTPDHWHAIMTIQACQAGLDVYVEKPLSLTIVEGRRMVEAVHKYKRVAQVGTHRRSLPWCADAARLCRDGELGHITVAESYYVANDWPNGIGNPPDSAPPPGVDWDLWLGPAPAEPYNQNKAFYNFRWFYPYSGGQVTNMGVHYLDIIQWGLGQRAPKRITGFGGVYAVNDNRQVPDTAKIIWEYDKALVSFDQINANGAQPDKGQELLYRGTKGSLYLYGDGYEIVPDVIRDRSASPVRPSTARPSANGAGNEDAHRAAHGSQRSARHGASRS